MKKICKNANDASNGISICCQPQDEIKKRDNLANLPCKANLHDPRDVFIICVLFALLCEQRDKIFEFGWKRNKIGVENWIEAIARKKKVSHFHLFKIDVCACWTETYFLSTVCRVLVLLVTFGGGRTLCAKKTEGTKKMNKKERDKAREQRDSIRADGVSDGKALSIVLYWRK